MLIDPKELGDRYVAVWNQPDAERRRTAIAELWTEDGVQFLQPPQQVREAAAGLGLTPILQARGHDELEVRVTRSPSSRSPTGGAAHVRRRSVVVIWGGAPSQRCVRQ